MKIDLNKINYVHFIGIGGISMSSIAQILKNWGKKISGSDKQKNEITLSLQKNGIRVFYRHSKNNISNNIDLVVYTSAVKKDNIELLTAKSFNIPTIERAKFLQVLASYFSNVIAVSGTHGKTTTCGMIASIFYEGNLNPTVQIGGIMKNANSNYICGGREFFITEACEYKKHLLTLSPTVGVVLNMEPDHMECYKNYNDLVKCFKKFLRKSKVAICNNDYDNTINYLKQYKIKNVRKNKFDNYSFDVYNDNEKMHILLKVPGKHNIYNALCAITVAKIYNIPNNYISLGLKNYLGIKRRFEIMGKVNNATLINDYAHHPTEISSTIKILKELKKPYVVIFQPHTYSRTEKLFCEFIGALKDEKNVYIYKTYPAREVCSMGKSGKELCDSLVNTKYIKNITQLIEKIKDLSHQDINIALIGAGDMQEKVKKLLL